MILERIHDHAILICELKARSGNLGSGTCTRLRSYHQRIGRYLTRIEFHNLFHVFMEDIKRLTTEAEHHVNIAGGEEFLRILKAFVNLLSGTKFLISVRKLQNFIIETLYADGHTVDEPLQVAKLRRHDDLRIRFA